MKRIVIAVDGFVSAHREQILNATAGWGEAVFAKQNDPGLEALVHRADAVVGWPDSAWLAGGSTQLAQILSVGVDAYAGKGLAVKPDFILCNASGVTAVACAEHLLALMFALARRLSEHARDQPEQVWQRQTHYAELFGSTACVVGLGHIGGTIAGRLRALGLRVIGVSKSGAAHPEVETVYALEDLPRAVALANHLVLTAPAVPGAPPLVTRELLAVLPPGACLYNIGRGSLVDEAALVEALESGHLAGAGLDVFVQEPLPSTSPLWRLPGVLITPHVAGRSSREYDRLCALAIDNLCRWGRGQPLLNPISKNLL